MGKYLLAGAGAVGAIVAAKYATTADGVLKDFAPKTADGFDWRPYAAAFGALLLVGMVLK